MPLSDDIEPETDLEAESTARSLTPCPAPEIAADPHADRSSTRCWLRHLHRRRRLEADSIPRPAAFRQALIFSAAGLLFRSVEAALSRPARTSQSTFTCRSTSPTARSTRRPIAGACSGHKMEIAAPQRGEKRSLVDLVCQNAKQSFDQRFRVLQPSAAKAD